MVFNATFNNISVISAQLVLLVEETITTNVVSSNSVHGEVYSIQHYVIKWFFLGTLVSSTNKTNCADITEMLLKVALNTIITSMSNENAIQILLKVAL
jgi:hypothetical protein